MSRGSTGTPRAIALALVGIAAAGCESGSFFPAADAAAAMDAADAKDAFPQMRKLANPSIAFPKEGQQEFPPVWATAQSALRYIGWTQDPQSWPILENQLPKRLPLDTRAETPIRADAVSVYYRRWLRDHAVTYGAIPASA